MNIIIAPFESKKQKESILLRDAILRKPLKLKFTEEELAAEGDQTHILAMEEEKVVGVLLLKPLSETEIKMRQVAVTNTLQRRGIGIQMVRFAEYHARSKGYKVLSLHAREGAIPFYNSQNYKKVGKEFEEIGIPHFRMEKGL